MSNNLLSCRSRITKEELIFKKIQKQLMKGIPIMIQNYINKYNTPRVFQVFSTITFLTLPILMFLLEPFGLYDAFKLFARTYHIAVFDIFYWNFGSFARSLAQIIVVVAAITGIVFIWLNRPKASAICVGSLLLIMLLSLLRIWDFEDYYTTGIYDSTFLHVSVYDEYYIQWGALALLIIFLVLSLLSTKEGPRQPKAVTIIQPTSSAASSADEIMKFKELLDSGVITQEEFDAKKKEILGV